MTRSRRLSLAFGVFAIVLGSDAFFWHSRDWNTASRLMLSYAIVDRGTLEITGLDVHTGDKAVLHKPTVRNGKPIVADHYYSDKLPGYPFLAAIPYAAARGVLRLPPHPIGDDRARRYWPADYFVTLATSGLLTAGTAALLVLLALDLGCTPAASMVVGLGYGLGTPAYVYATLAYGHQSCAFALFASFLLLNRPGRGPDWLRAAVAGFLAAGASVIELQVAPVSAILGLYLLIEAGFRRKRPATVFAFALGAAIPTLGMLWYNHEAFGSPWDMGYFHHVTFSHVHTHDNPTGLTGPDWSKLGPLLVTPYRGLLVYAPLLILAVPGWIVLLARRAWAMAAVSFLVCVAVLLVNLSYPEWTGGWSTGPRLLLPLIPFAMVPVAAFVSIGGRWTRPILALGLILAVAGAVEMLLFQGAGARIPNDPPARGRSRPVFSQPLVDAVWPIWTGETPTPGWRFGERFARNLVSIAAPGAVASLPPAAQALQFLPLVVLQAAAIVLLWRAAAARESGT